MRTTSQEFRYASDTERQAAAGSAGAYLLADDRYIGTGNMVDTGDGVNRVYKTPRTTTGFPADFSIPNPQWTFLADSQDNFAWACVRLAVLQLQRPVGRDVLGALRRGHAQADHARRRRASFPAALASDLVTGQERKKTWDAMQPKLTVRWRPSDNVTLYGDLSRGFRSGGFNQSGVALAGVAGVKDTFDQQIADTIEFGVKTQLNNNRISLNAGGIHDRPHRARITSFSSSTRARRTSAASTSRTTRASRSSSTRS